MKSVVELSQELEQTARPPSDVERTLADDGAVTDIQYITFFGFKNIDDARQEARALLGDRVRLFALVAQTGRGTLDGTVVGYFCQPEGQRCHTCGTEAVVFPRDR